MPLRQPEDMVGREAEWARLCDFATSGEAHASLGMVWGRRRIGKTFLLESIVEQTGGFYYGAIRGSAAEALRELGGRLADHQKVAAPLALADWEAGVRALLALGAERETVVVLDEYPYLLEHTPQLDSIIQRALAPRSPSRTSSRARLILCGSAMTLMRRVLGGTAALRGRAGMDLRLSAFDFRVARELHGIADGATTPLWPGSRPGTTPTASWRATSRCPALRWRRSSRRWCRPGSSSASRIRSATTGPRTIRATR
jgi:hypothetical protein